MVKFSLMNCIKMVQRQWQNQVKLDLEPSMLKFMQELLMLPSNMEINKFYQSLMKEIKKWFKIITLFKENKEIGLHYILT